MDGSNGVRGSDFQPNSSRLRYKAALGRMQRLAGRCGSVPQARVSRNMGQLSLYEHSPQKHAPRAGNWRGSLIFCASKSLTSFTFCLAARA